MPPAPSPTWFDEPLVQRFEDTPGVSDPHPWVEVWLRQAPAKPLRWTHVLHDQLTFVAADAAGLPCLVVLSCPLLGDGLVRLVSQLLTGSRPKDDNPFAACPLTADALRGLIAALDRASAMLPVPSMLREHPDAPRAA